MLPTYECDDGELLSAEINGQHEVDFLISVLSTVSPCGRVKHVSSHKICEVYIHL
jgi:hypothetical protein